MTILLQTGFSPVMENGSRSAVISGKQGRLWLGTYGPELAWKAHGPNDFEKSWVYKKLAAEGKLAWHTLEAEYAPDADSPLVTVFVPLGAGGPPPRVTVTRSAGSVEVKLPGAKQVRFLKDAQGWRPQDQGASSKAR